VFLVLFNAVVVPIQIAFAPAWASHVAFIAFDAIVDAMFWIDFIVNMRTGFMDKWGVLVTDPR
jgi:hypothetical protein